MRSLFISLLGISCTLTIDTPPGSTMDYPNEYEEQPTDADAFSGMWSLVSTDEEYPPTPLLILRIYTSANSNSLCPSMTASVANIHEVKFYNYYDLCYNGEIISSTFRFPYVSDFYVEGRLTLHPGIQTTECVHNPTRVDCVPTDDYYLLTLDLYFEGNQVYRRIYRKTTPGEFATKLPYPIFTLYDDQGEPYEFLLDSAREGNDVSQFCPTTKRALIRFDSQYSFRIPFEVACVAADNTFTDCPYIDRSLCITGSISKDIDTITYYDLNGVLHSLTQ